MIERRDQIKKRLKKDTKKKQKSKDGQHGLY